MERTHGPGANHPADCFGCHLLSISIRPASSFKPHYNYAVGKYVNTDREFRDELKRAANHSSEILGIDHDFEPRYPGDLGEEAPYPEQDQVIETRGKNIMEGIT